MDLELPVPLAVAVPLVARVEIFQVSVSLFASVAFRVREKTVGEPSSDMVTAAGSLSVMTGALWVDCEPVAGEVVR